MKRKFLVQVTITGSVDIEDAEIKTAIKRGLYRGLDTEPKCIAAPANVSIEFIENDIDSNSTR